MIKDSGDIPTQCPYDNTHIVCSRGLAMHLIKCRQNHKGHKKVTCKFDKTHVMPKPELPHHLSICPSRYLLDRELQLKAATEAGGVLSGDVKGPKIVTSYINNEEEDWGAASSCEAPIALFNRKETEYIETSRPFRPVGAAPEERSYSKFPLSSSKAAKISEISHHTQPPVGNQVYLLSFEQSMNVGWGRGRGDSQNNAPQSNPVVGHSASSGEYPKNPQPMSIHSHSGIIKHSSGVAAEHDCYDDQTTDNNVPNFYQYPRHYKDALDPDQFLDLTKISMCNNPSGISSNESRGHGFQSSFIKSGDVYSKKDIPETVNGSQQQQLNFPSFSAIQTSSAKGPIRPAGRGIFRGNEPLRTPTSSSMAQAISQGAHENFKVTETQIQPPAEDNDAHDSSPHDSETMDFSTLNRDNLLKTKRKLGKKLKQIQVLEKKVLDGAKLTDEENCKLEKRCEIESLVEKISAFL